MRYTLFDEIAASHVHPIQPKDQATHLAVIQNAFDRLRLSVSAAPADWQVVATAINLMETLIEMGVLQDPDKLHADTITAMREAQKHYSFKMDVAGLAAIKNLLEDYAEVLKVLPERTMIQAYRKTEAKVPKMFGKHTKKRNVTGRF